MDLMKSEQIELLSYEDRGDLFRDFSNSSVLEGLFEEDDDPYIIEDKSIGFIFRFILCLALKVFSVPVTNIVGYSKLMAFCL